MRSSPFIVRATRRCCSILFIALASTSSAHAYANQDELPSKVSSDLLVFQCKKSFTGHGVGLCNGRVDVALRGLAAPLTAAEFRCEVTIRYWWQEGREQRVELKPLVLNAPADRLGYRFADAAITFETDLTSVVREPQGADVSRIQCEAAYRTQY